LTINDDPMSARALSRLMRSLAHNRTLQEITLTSSIPLESMRHLLDSLRVNTTLQLLDITMPRASREQQMQMLADTMRDANFCVNHMELTQLSASPAKTALLAVLQRNRSIEWIAVRPLLLDMCIGLSTFLVDWLPPYVLLHIFEQFPYYDKIPHKKMISMILGVRKSVRRIHRLRQIELEEKLAQLTIK
jgi:hypothetical protein